MTAVTASNCDKFCFGACPIGLKCCLSLAFDGFTPEMRIKLQPYGPKFLSKTRKGEKTFYEWPFMTGTQLVWRSHGEITGRRNYKLKKVCSWGLFLLRHETGPDTTRKAPEGLEFSPVEMAVPADLFWMKQHACEFWKNSLGRYQTKLILCHLLDYTASLHQFFNVEQPFCIQMVVPNRG